MAPATDICLRDPRGRPHRMIYQLLRELDLDETPGCHYCDCPWSQDVLDSARTDIEIPDSPSNRIVPTPSGSQRLYINRLPSRHSHSSSHQQTVAQDAPHAVKNAALHQATNPIMASNVPSRSTVPTLYTSYLSRDSTILTEQ